MFKTIVSLFFTFIPVLVFADSKVVNIAITEYPPFEWTINDNVLGADADTVVEVFMRIGYEAKLISMPWSKAFTSTQNGEFDALMSIKKSPERELNFLFSEPIAYSQNFIFKKKSLNLELTKISDLKPYKIATIEGYAYGKEFNEAQLSLEPIVANEPEMANLRKLAADDVDLVVCEINVCTNLLNIHKEEFQDIEYVKSLPVDNIDEYRVAFPRKNSARSEELLQVFNAELQKYVAEGKRDQNLTKYQLKNLTK